MTFAYDGHLPTVETWSGGTGAVAGFVTRQYNTDFRLASARINNAVVANYTYDPDGLLLTAGALTLQRDPVSGDIDGTTLNTIVTQNDTDGFGDRNGYFASRNGIRLFSEEIVERDEAGRIVERVETVLDVATSYRYAYDTVGRLVDVEINGVVAAHYDYDVNGNRLAAMRIGGTETGSYGDDDRLISYGGRNYGFDASGDLQSLSSAAGTTTYDYDELGNLREVSLPDGRVIGYEIDSLNRRTGKRINGARQYGLLYKDELAPAALLNASNQVVATFMYGTDDRVPDFMIRSGVPYRFITDRLGSIRLVINASTGSISQRIDYDEFGNATLMSGTWDVQPFGFAGGLYDPDTKQVRFGARDYDALTGRWTAKDSALFGGRDTNFYSYVGNDPIGRMDPGGLQQMGDAVPSYGAGLYVCSRTANAAGLKQMGANHAYFFNHATGEICGRQRYSSGGDNPDELMDPEDLPAWDPAARCTFIQGSQGKEEQIMNCCRQTANSGIFLFNNCHLSIDDCLKENGVTNPGAPGGAFGNPTCDGGCE